MTFSKFVKVALATEHEFLKVGTGGFWGCRPGILNRRSQQARGDNPR